VAEVVAAVERCGGTSLTRVVVGRRAGDPPVLVAGAEKAREVLGWRPTCSDIDHIVQTSWRWHVQDADWGRAGTY
jgi:UDP-glucose 4-epimerase